MDARRAGSAIIIRRLGQVSLAAFGAHTVLSYGTAAIVPLVKSAPEGPVFARALGVLGWNDTWLEDWVTGRILGEVPALLPAAYALPLLVSTIAFVAAVFVIRRGGPDVDPGLPRSMFRWAVAFAVVAALAVPVASEDFWFSFLWGRMAAEGVNPYHAGPPASLLADLPIRGEPSRMTYGPLWALLSGLVALIGLGRWWLMAILFKLALLAAWLGTLLGTWKLVGHRGPAQQSHTLAVVGWLPLGVHLAVAEGHNDVVMVLGIVGWLLALKRGRRASTVALSASAAVKYVSLPLLALDAVRWLRWDRDDRRYLRYAGQLAIAGLLLLVLLGAFYRSPAFFDPVRVMRGWNFLRPADATGWLGGRLGFPPWLAVLATQGAFLAWTLWLASRYVFSRSESALYRAGLGVMTAVLFTGVGHVWPWFLLWVLPFVALCPAIGLGRFSLGVAMGAPFALLPWTFDVKADGVSMGIPAVCLYAFALFWWRYGIDPGPEG